MQAITKTVSASGFMNFVNAFSGALATLLVTTSCQDRATYACAELSGLAGSSGEVARLMAGAERAIRVFAPTAGREAGTYGQIEEKVRRWLPDTFLVALLLPGLLPRNEWEPVASGAGSES